MRNLNFNFSGKPQLWCFYYRKTLPSYPSGSSSLVSSVLKVLGQGPPESEEGDLCKWEQDTVSWQHTLSNTHLFSNEGKSWHAYSYPVLADVCKLSRCVSGLGVFVLFDFAIV